MGRWSSSSVWVVTAASSANRKSLRHTSRTLVFAFSLETLKSLPSDLVRRYMPSVAVQKACLSITAKTISKSVGARTHPCFTPLRMSNSSDAEPTYTVVPFMPSWKDCMMLKSVGGQPILTIILKWPSLLARSKALGRSMKAMYSGFLCSLHSTCSCHNERTTSTVDPWDLNPHCDSGSRQFQQCYLVVSWGPPGVARGQLAINHVNTANL